MPAPATTEEFLNLVRQSGLLEENCLAAYVLQRAPDLPEEPAALAKLLVRDGLVTRFQADLFIRGKSRGFLIGNYKVLDRIGAGGMAQVYLCEHRQLRRRVAIKVLPSDFAKDPEYLQRFQREVRAVAALEHPNIVRAYDVGQDNNLHFLVMEYVEGRPLHELVKRDGPLPFATAADYARQAALGLQHAHEAGLVHRDIKPGNLMVDRSGTVKVLDLGLARFRQEDNQSQILTQGILGTPDYLSPEQARDSHTVDIRADIYSLGCTLFYLIAGRPPFEGTPAQKIAFHQSNDPPPLLGMLRPDTPAELEQIVRKMMAKNPADRYRIPADVAEALAPFAQPPNPPSTDVEKPTPSQLGAANQETDPDLLTPLSPGTPPNSNTGPRRRPPPVPPSPPADVGSRRRTRLKSPAPPPPRSQSWRWIVFAIVILVTGAVVGWAVDFLTGR